MEIEKTITELEARIPALEKAVKDYQEGRDELGVTFARLDLDTTRRALDRLHLTSKINTLCDELDALPGIEKLVAQDKIWQLGALFEASENL